MLLKLPNLIRAQALVDARFLGSAFKLWLNQHLILRQCRLLLKKVTLAKLFENWARSVNTILVTFKLFQSAMFILEKKFLKNEFVSRSLSLFPMHILGKICKHKNEVYKLWVKPFGK